MEHRWGARSKLDIPVQLECGSQGLVLGVMRDASVSGAFLNIAVQLQLLTCVSVSLGSALAAPQSSGIRACIVRRAPEGVGIEWEELAPAVIVELLAMLAPPSLEETPQERTEIPARLRPVDLPDIGADLFVARRQGG